MSATLEATRPAGTKKKFGKSEREVPHHSQKAKKWYPAEDIKQPRKVSGFFRVESLVRLLDCVDYTSRSPIMSREWLLPCWALRYDSWPPKQALGIGI